MFFLSFPTGIWSDLPKYESIFFLKQYQNFLCILKLSSEAVWELLELCCLHCVTSLDLRARALVLTPEPGALSHIMAGSFSASFHRCAFWKQACCQIFCLFVYYSWTFLILYHFSFKLIVWVLYCNSWTYSSTHLMFRFISSPFFF